MHDILNRTCNAIITLVLWNMWSICTVCIHLHGTSLPILISAHFFISIILSNPSGLSFQTAAGPYTGEVGSSIGIAVGVSVSVTFVVSFSMGVLVASVLGYISRRSQELSHKPSSHADNDLGPERNAIVKCANKKPFLPDLGRGP